VDSTRDDRPAPLDDAALRLATGGAYITRGDGGGITEGTCGDDLIVTGRGEDEVNAGHGDDTIVGGDGDDLIFASGGDDAITTGQGNDRVVPGDGNDSVFTGDGDDVIFLGRENWDQTQLVAIGNDLVEAGAGNDRLMVSPTPGHVSFDGGPGQDTIILTPAWNGWMPDTCKLTGVTQSWSRDGDGHIVFAGPASGTLTWGDTVISFTNVERIELPKPMTSGGGR
jgi:Ca2+-binding RTX toxin-like protein